MREMILNGLQQAYANLEHMLAEFFPRLLVMLIIIFVGWLVAYLLKLVVRAILRVTKLDRVSEEAGASRILRKADLPAVSELVSRALFWLIWLGFIVVGISVLGIVSLQQQIERLILLLPQILVAFVILFVGLLAANFFSRAALLAGVNASLPSPRLLSEAIRIIIGFLAFSMALEQIGLAKQTVLMAFSIVFGALMLGLAIAFGLAGRDLARKVLEKQFVQQDKPREDELSPL
jgi:Mechanosensitive ion channel, conserved TM helix